MRVGGALAGPGTGRDTIRSKFHNFIIPASPEYGTFIDLVAHDAQQALRASTNDTTGQNYGYEGTRTPYSL